MSALKALAGMTAGILFVCCYLLLYALYILFIVTIIYFFLAAAGIVPELSIIPLIPFV